MTNSRTLDFGFAARLVAEFGVIVLGVLVALAVDSWVGQRAQREDERQALETLRADLVLSSQDLRDVSAETAVQVARLNWLQNFPVDRSREFPVDSLFAINSAANVTNAYVPILRTYEALVATGQLGLIRSQPIQMDLASLRKEMEVYLDFRDQSTTLWLLSYKPMWDRYIGGEFGRGGGTVGPLPAPDVVEVMQSREFRALVSSRRVFLNIVTYRGQDLAEAMEALISLIDAETAMRAE